MSAKTPSAGTDAATTTSAPRIGELLLERGLITPDQMQQALVYQQKERPNKLLGQLLIELRLVTAADLVATLAEASGIQFVTIAPPMVDANAVALLPRKFIDAQSVLPLSVTDEGLTVAVEDFMNVFLAEDIERLSGRRVQLVAATRQNIREVLASLAYGHEEFAFDEIIDEMEGENITLVEQRPEELEDLRSAASNSPVIKLVNHVIHGAIHEGASDIHIEPDSGRFRVRYRIDGALYERLHPPFGLFLPVVSRIKIMAGLDIAERRVPQDGSMTVMLEQQPVDLRISTMPTKFGEKVVMRVIDNRKSVLDLSSLGFSPAMLGDLRDLIAEPNGVILVTGPTGSGKSTTLYACLAEISTIQLNLSTIEDPIEYNLHGVNQAQINDKAGFTFARALRAMLRQDPDVIMVGEIRDNETAEISVQAALTGHLVLSTLHTNDAPSAVTRLTNMGIQPYLVAASLRGVLAQRLLRRICSHCKGPTELSPTTEQTVRQVFGGVSPVETFYGGKGCARCRGMGHSGRLGIYELLAPDSEMLEAISSEATLQEIRRMAHDSKYTTLRQDGIEKVAAGLTCIEALLEIVARKSDGGANAESDDRDEPWHVPTRSDD